MTRPRVLLVEDDAAVRRFVQAALEDIEVDLHMTSGIADAVAQLAAAPFALVLTDLMLGGESGRTLVQRLQREPALGGAPLVAVYSAGLTPDVCAELSRLGAWRLLHKPVPVADLRQCVRDAVGIPMVLADAASAEPQGQVSQSRPAPAGVIETYFGGNERIYLGYREACEQQFPADVAEGDRAVAAQDAQAMRRLAHSLKSVLQALGHAQATDVARAIDIACVKNDWPGVLRQWPVLRVTLLGLGATAGD